MRRGAVLPPDVLSAITEAVGEEPYMAVQANACFAYDEARRQADDAKLAVM